MAHARPAESYRAARRNAQAHPDKATKATQQQQKRATHTARFNAVTYAPPRFTYAERRNTPLGDYRWVRDTQGQLAIQRIQKMIIGDDGSVQVNGEVLPDTHAHYEGTTLVIEPPDDDNRWATCP